MSTTELILSNQFYNLGSGLSIPCEPQGIKQPKWVRKNADAVNLLGLSPQIFESQYYLDIFSGNCVVKDTQPVAQSYAGHQFGKFNPFLGDGRSVLIGEIASPTGVWDIALKGSGKTPFTFSSADGRASLGECLHEYSISERLANLDIPTVRSLCVVKGDDQVYRSGFDSAAMLTRTAQSFIRFGTFEACYFRKDVTALKILADYVIKCYFPEISLNTRNEDAKYSQFFHQVVVRTAKLIALWQNARFVHGMMNTDNQSIVGITLDVGDSAFIGKDDDNFVASRSDENGRYAFCNQPAVGLWNCNVLAQALSPLVSAADLRKSLAYYESIYFEYLTL